MTRRVYNVKEVAQILGVTLSTAYMLTARKDFPAIRVSARRIVIPVDAFERWLSRQTGEEPDVYSQYGAGR